MRGWVGGWRRTGRTHRPTIGICERTLTYFKPNQPLQVERLWRDAKLLEIGGGTNEAHHKNMCRDLKRAVTQLK